MNKEIKQAMSDIVLLVQQELGNYSSKSKSKTQTKRKLLFEVRWSFGESEEEAYNNDFLTKVFKVRKDALSFYRKHKNDPKHYDWQVTKRDADSWEIIEDIILD